MKEYVLRTHLLENPNIYLYFKGIEDPDEAYALNVVVAFSSDDALLLEKSEAERLRMMLNKDREVLCERGYSAFEIV